MSETHNYTSLAIKLRNEGFSKTPIAVAVTELVASWLGTTIENRGLLMALQATKGDTAEVLNLEAGSTAPVVNASPWAANDSLPSGVQSPANEGYKEPLKQAA